MISNILIVDADPAAATATSAFVQRLVPNAAITCEATPERAWWAAQTAAPEVLVIDPAPFTTSGSVLIDLCQQTWPAIRLMVLTSAPISRQRIERQHADVYLEKPASPARLRVALAQLLGTA